MGRGRSSSAREASHRRTVTPDVREGNSWSHHGSLLALLCVVSWVAAASFARVVGLWWAVGGVAIVLGAVVVAVGGTDLRTLLRPNARLVLTGLAAGAGSIVATYLLYPILVRAAPWATLELELLYAAFRAPSTVVASLVLVPVVVGEELVWRGVVQTSLSPRLGRWGGAVTTAIVYAAVTGAVGSPLLVLVSLALGLLWSLLRADRSSLVPSLVAHLVWNAVVLLWLPLDLV